MLVKFEDLGGGLGSEPLALWRSRARRPGSLFIPLSLFLSRVRALAALPGGGQLTPSLAGRPLESHRGAGRDPRRRVRFLTCLSSVGGSVWVTLIGGRLGVENTGQGAFVAYAISARLRPAQGVSRPGKYRTQVAGAYGGVPAQDGVPWLVPSPASRVICRDGR